MMTHFFQVTILSFNPGHLQLKINSPLLAWEGKGVKCSGGEGGCWGLNLTDTQFTMDCTTVVGFILQMVEVMEGSSVYWYSHQRAYCSAFKSWAGYINASIDMFFNKDTLAACCAMGNERRSNGHQPLNQVIIQALIGRLYCILKLHLLSANTE